MVWRRSRRLTAHFSLTQRIAIIAIGVAARDPKHALGDQVADRVRDLRRVSIVILRGPLSLNSGRDID